MAKSNVRKAALNTNITHLKILTYHVLQERQYCDLIAESKCVCVQRVCGKVRVSGYASEVKKVPPNYMPTMIL